jgi:hypothetical protein
MIRARIAFRADPARRLIVVRYIGDLGGDQLCREMMDLFRDVENVWEYDCLYDLTRHEGTVSSAHNEELGRQWRDLVQGRDTGRCTAIVSRDPLLHARASVSQSAFSARTLALFYTVEEGEAWIADRRAGENRKSA